MSIDHAEAGGHLAEEGMLVERMRQGDESVLAELFTRLEPWARAQLRRRHGLSEADADDALAVARYRLWTARAQFDASKASLRTWHWTIASHCAIDLKRQQAPPDIQVRNCGELDRLIINTTMKSERVLTPAEQAVREVVDKLSGIERQIISQYAETFQCGSWAPVLASTLAMTLEAVRMRAMRIRQRVKREMARRGFDFGSSVLVAEDSRDSGRFMETVLKKAGSVVTLATDGRAAVNVALERFQAGGLFDFIFMDIRMPALDGYEATRMLRDADYPGRIIALTVKGSEDSYSNWIERGRCIEAGCNDYLTKPVTPEQLVRLVSRSGGR